MNNETELMIKKIGHIQTDFPEKFGVPRQSGLVEGLTGRIVFEPEYRVKEAFRGLEGFSHIWIIWEFSEVEANNKRAGENSDAETGGNSDAGAGGNSDAGADGNSDAGGWRPTVRPPVLGGNKRMGVFATRSPFRPNRIGLSSVKLERIDFDDEEGPVLYVSGIDMVDGTPILDIKPYIAYADSHPDAEDGFLGQASRKKLKVVISKEATYCLGSFADADGLKASEFPDGYAERYETSNKVDQNELNKKLQVMKEVLEQGPLPAYASDPERIYGMSFAGMDVKFSVDGDILTVLSVTPAPTDQVPECDTSS